MLKRLNLALGSPRGWQLLAALKSGLFAFALYYFGKNQPGFILPLGIGAYFYFKETLNWRFFGGSWAVLMATALMSVFQLSAPGSLAAAFYFGFLFFLLLGIKNLVLVRRDVWFYILSNLLLATALVLFTAADKSSFFPLKFLFLCLALFFLIREFLIFIYANPSLYGLRGLRVVPLNLVASAITLSALELSWVLSIMPIGLINASALLLIYLITIKDLVLYYLSGTLSNYAVLRSITFGLISIFLILAISNWSLSL